MVGQKLPKNRITSQKLHVRFKVGEGIEKVEADFADEVAQMAGTR